MAAGLSEIGRWLLFAALVSIVASVLPFVPAGWRAQMDDATLALSVIGAVLALLGCAGDHNNDNLGLKDGAKRTRGRRRHRLLKEGILPRAAADRRRATRFEAIGMFTEHAPALRRRPGVECVRLGDGAINIYLSGDPSPVCLPEYVVSSYESVAGTPHHRLKVLYLPLDVFA